MRGNSLGPKTIFFRAEVKQVDDRERVIGATEHRHYLIICLTSSTSFSHRSIPSKLHLFVMSYTKITPWAPREYDRIMVQNLPCPDVSHNCSFTLLPSNNIVVVLYATKKISLMWVWRGKKNKKFYLQFPPPLQNGLSVDPSSKPAMISCFPTSLSPTSNTFSK